MNTLSKHPLSKQVSAILLGALVGLGTSLTATAQDKPADGLYQALGAQDGIGKTVDDLIVLIQSDVRIKDSFKDTSMKHLAQMLKEQFCELSGGPCKYSGDDMKLVHEKLGVTSTQFNALAEDLQMAMEKNNIPFSAQNKLIAKLAPMQRTIVPAK